MIELAFDFHHHDLFLTPEIAHFLVANYKRLLFTIIVVVFLNELVRMKNKSYRGSRRAQLFGISLNTIVLAVTFGKIVYETQPKKEPYDYLEHLENFLQFSYHQVGLNLQMEHWRSPVGYVALSAVLYLAVFWIYRFVSRQRLFRYFIIALAGILYFLEFPISSTTRDQYSGKMFDLHGDSARIKFGFIPRILLFTIVSWRLFLFCYDSVKYFISLALRVLLLALCVGFCLSFYFDYLDKNSTGWSKLLFKKPFSVI